MSFLSEAQLVKNAFIIERFLGEGGFPEVYRVMHRFLWRQAMKVFKLHSMSMDEIEKQLGEALTRSQLGHPNIIGVFDAKVLETSKARTGDFPIEYVTGGSLDHYWKSFGSQFKLLKLLKDPIPTLAQAMYGPLAAHFICFKPVSCLSLILMRMGL
jgi:eukaryotic-like serine/threonine-protein kinase